MSEVPTALQKRKPYEVEDILCIYEDRFCGVTMPAKGCAPKRPKRIC